MSFESAPARALPERSVGPASEGQAEATRAESDEAIVELEERLVATREHLQSIIEEREATNEELQAANEEILSSNEELQSVNEELQTTKEEMESTNEELQTVNEELGNRNQELDKLTNDLMNLLASVHIPIVMVGNDLRIRRFTPTAEKLLNLIPTDIGRPIGDIKPNVDIPDLEPLLLDTIENVCIHERDVRDRSGHWYVTRIRPYRTRDNRIEGAVIGLVDVDDIKRSLEESQAARAYADAIVETVREPLVVFDGELRVQRANAAFYQTFKTSAEATEGRPLQEAAGGALDVPELRRLVEEELARVPRVEGVEITHGFPTIGTRTLLLNARRIARREGVADQILLAIEDITERSLAEARVRASEIRFRKLFEASSDGILLVDGETGRIADVNSALLELLEDGSEALVGQRLVDVGPLRALASTVRDAADATSDAATAPTHIALEQPDGRRVDVEVITSAYEAGPARLLIYNLRDVTERRRVEESERRLAREQAARAEAERENRMKDLFLGTLSHELRTPINASLGWTQLLRGGRLEAAAVTRGLEAIERNTIHQARLINDLLDVSRIVAGKLALDVRPVDLATVVESAADEIRAGASARSIDIHVDVGSEAVLVGGDASRLQQVVANLLANAVKFSKPGQSVSIRLERDTRDARIVVADRGAGIAPEFLPFVFERFRQGDESFARTHGGLGIGLAIVRHIVELHGGTVRAESAGVDAGATFIVTLPVLSEAASGLVSDAALRAIVSSPALPPTACLTGLRVVLVEDEEDARTLFAMVLEREGARVAAAGSAVEAIAHFEREVPDVLVSDIGLPEVDGYELIARVRALGPEYGGDVPAVALTAYASAADVSQALEAGYQTHLSKPVELAKLVRTLAELAGRARTEPSD